MKPVLRFELLAPILLIMLSFGMSTAIAGNKLLVSPIKVTPHPAQTYHYRAKTRAAVWKSGRVQAGSLGWQCQGKDCTISGPWPVPSVSACQALARLVGPIRSYGHGRKKLGSNELIQCNAGVAAKASPAKAPAPMAGAVGITAGRPTLPITPALGRSVQPKLKVPTTPVAPRQPLSPVLNTVNKKRTAASIAGKKARGVTPIPAPIPARITVPGVTRPIAHNPGIAPSQSSGTKPLGLNKPVTGPGGKSLLPPPETAGKRHLMKDNSPTTLGAGFVSPPSPRINNPVPGVTPSVGHKSGFAASPMSGTKPLGLNKPVTGPGGKSLLPPQVTAGERHLMMDEAPAARGGGFVPLPSPRVNIPVTAPGGGSLLSPAHEYLLRAETEIIDPVSNDILRQVDPRQAVVVRVTVHNVGTARSPRFRIVSRRYGQHGPIDGLEPGGTYQIGFRDGVGENHQSNDQRYWFAGSYTLRSTDSTPLRVTHSASTEGMKVPVRGIPELAVTEISDVRLHMISTPLDAGVRRRLHGHLSSGVDERVSARVTIENYGNGPSSATSLSVKLESTGLAVAPRTDPSLTYTGSTSGNGAPSGTLTYEMPIPAIPAHGSITRDIRFNHVFHELWDRDIRTSQGLGLRHNHQHIPEAVGAFACGRESWSHYQGWQGSSFRITVWLPETEETSVTTRDTGGRFAVSQDRMSCGVEGS